MNDEQLVKKLKELRDLRDHSRDRMRAYAPGSMMRCTFEGRVSAIEDVLRTFEKDLPPFELKHFRRPDGKE